MPAALWPYEAEIQKRLEQMALPSSSIYISIDEPPSCKAVSHVLILLQPS